MLTRLRLWLWEHRRRVLERRYVETGAAHRDARTALLEHEGKRPGQRRSHEAVTHRFWRGNVD